MSQARRQPTTLRAKAEPTITNLDPAAFPNVYGMKVIGDCMSPLFTTGATLCFDKTAPVEVGDIVIVFLRPEIVPPGKMQAGVKRLVTAIPSCVKSFPFEDHPESDVLALIELEMDNPPRRFRVKCRDILAIHKCLGVARQEKQRGSIPAPMLPQQERVAASASGIGAEKPVSRRRFMGTSAAFAAATVALPATAIEGGDAELFHLEAEFHAAKERWNEASDRMNDAEEAYYKVVPKAPERIPMPGDIDAEFRNLTVDQFCTLQQVAPDHPYLVWSRANEAAVADAHAAWSREINRISAECGVDKADDEQSARFEDIDAVYDAIMDTPAATLAGVMVKLRRCDWPEDGDEERMSKLVQSVAADIERIAGGGNA